MSATGTASGGLQRYYRLQAGIYDASRWAFLFGRTALVDEIVALRPARILEVGCGTGFNLLQLARRLPQARFTGIDLSPDMLQRARRKLAPHAERVELRCEAFSSPLAEPGYDLVLFSYALTMMNPGYEQVLDAACASLVPQGQLAVVDFDRSPLPAFERWMALNHVRMQGQVRAALQQRLAPCSLKLHSAYGGLWQWVSCIGRPAGLAAASLLTGPDCPN